MTLLKDRDTTVRVARARASEMADFFCGLTAKGALADDYRTLLFPNDDTAKAKQFAAGMSSCALFALAVWRELGVPHAILQKPYASRIGQAVSDVVRIATDYHAWCPWRDKCQDDDLGPGDVILMGPPEHVVVVTTVDDADGSTIYGVAEGGQVGAEGYAIGCGKYILDYGKGPQPLVRAVKEPVYSPRSPSKGRPLIGSCSLEELLDGAGLL